MFRKYLLYKEIYMCQTACACRPAIGEEMVCVLLVFAYAAFVHLF